MRSQDLSRFINWLLAVCVLLNTGTLLERAKEGFEYHWKAKAVPGDPRHCLYTKRTSRAEPVQEYRTSNRLRLREGSAEWNAKQEEGVRGGRPTRLEINPLRLAVADHKVYNMMT